MKFYSGIVKCGTCGVALSKAINVPEDQCLNAAIAASDRAFCPGHSKNSNLDFEWVAQPGVVDPPPAVPIADREFRGGMINMPEEIATAPMVVDVEVPAPPKVTADGIALEDLAEAAGVAPEAVLITDDAVYIGASGENGIQPVRVIGKRAPRPDQLG